MTRGRSNQRIPLCSDNIVEHCGSKTEQLTADRITEASGLHYSDCLAELGLSSSQHIIDHFVDYLPSQPLDW